MNYLSRTEISFRVILFQLICAISAAAIAIMFNLSIIMLAIVVLLIMQFNTIIVMFIDKYAATHGRNRIPEITLYLLALFGGSPGLLFGIKLFRHKTQKSSFLGVISLILLIQIIVLVGLYKYFY